MMPVGATWDSPSSAIGPRRSPYPPMSAVTTGVSTRATSTETRLNMVSSRKPPIVQNPRAASMGRSLPRPVRCCRRVSERRKIRVQHRTQIYPCVLRNSSPGRRSRIRSPTMDVTLRQLTAYTAVARAVSFTAAAAELHVSQSSLSRAVADLERTLGMRLLERDTRNVELTPAGTEPLRIADQILAAHRAGLAQLGRYVAGERGAVSLATPPSVAGLPPPPVISAFRARRPE